MIIVVGLDASDQSVTALARAFELAKPLEAEVRAVHVLHTPAALLAAMAQVPAPIHEYGDAVKAEVWARHGEAIDNAPVPVTIVDLEGYAADVLVGYADEVGADLIVVGSRGRGDLAALVLGSTSHRVLHMAKCDVLIVRAEETE